MEQKEKKACGYSDSTCRNLSDTIMGLPLIWAVYTSLTDKVIGAAQV